MMVNCSLSKITVVSSSKNCSIPEEFPLGPSAASVESFLVDCVIFCSAELFCSSGVSIDCNDVCVSVSEGVTVCSAESSVKAMSVLGGSLVSA